MLKKIIILLMLFVVPTSAYARGIVFREDNGIYIFKIPLNKYSEKIKPYVADKLTTTSDVFKTGKYELVVNGGFFDINTGADVSTVIIDRKKVQSLFNNPSLAKRLDEANRAEAVLGRTELRILNDEKTNKLVFDIQGHFEKNKNEIVHSLQAGPMILPHLNLLDESFIKYDGGKVIGIAADVLKRRERTVIGIKYNPVLGDTLYIIIFSRDNKVALTEARAYCKGLGIDKALAMDGGASTSINYDDIEIYSASDGQRKVKSFLVIEKDKE